MKKLLLTLFLALTAIAIKAQAVVVDLTFTEENKAFGLASKYGDSTVNLDDCTLVFTNFNQNGNTITDCPVAKASNLVISLKNGATFASVKFTLKQWTNKAKTASLQYSTNGTDFSAFNPAIASSVTTKTNSVEFEIEATDIPDGTVAIKLDLSSNANQVGVMSIEYSVVAGGDVTERAKVPDFSVPAGSVEKGTMVELTCETEGAAIYYTLNGTIPTTESTLYTAPITINETTTVNAIAVKEGMENSSVRTAKYTVMDVYDTLAAFIEAKPQDYAILDAPLTVYYYGISGNNHYLYVTDGTVKTFLWNPVGNYKNGDVIPAGLVGKYNSRLNEIEVDTNYTIGETTTGTAIEPTVVTEVTKDMLHDYVKIEGVTINNISGYNATATFDNKEIALYNRFTTSFGTTIPEGENMTIVGIVNIYNSTGQSGTEGNLQVYLTEIIEPEPTEVAALTITPEFGTIYTGQEIVIDCETEGALLTGYIGDTEINGEAMPYTYTVNEAVGTKIDVAVYGHKAGLTHTEELEGEFTVAERPSLVNNEATFDWADIASLRTFLPEDKRDKLSNGTKLSSYTFTNKVVELTFKKSSNSNNNEPTYYDTDNTLRIYVGNTMTVKLNSTVGHIDSITFGYSSGSLSLAADQEGVMSANNTVWTANASRASDGVSDVTFTSSGTTKIKTIKVAYTDVPTGITAVEAAESDAPAVFYNLQGIRVNNPANGIFIRVQGNNVDKVLVK